MNCEQCDAVYINGVFCHEAGCPESHKNTTRECENCGGDFIPERREQKFCDDSCYCAYNGLECEDDDNFIDEP